MNSDWTCPSCHHRNAASMRFCPECGVAKPVAGGSTLGPLDQPARPGPNRWLWGVAVGLWVIGLAVLAVGGGIWLARPEQAEPAGPAAVAVAPVVETATPTALPAETPIPAPPSATPAPTEAPPTATPSPTARPPTATPRPAGGDTLRLPSPTPTETETPPPSPTSPPRPVAPPPTPVPLSGCPPGAQITSPRPGTVFQQRNNFILGVANIIRFHHWRIEYSTAPGGGWNFLLERDYPVENDKLVMIDASTVPRGPYGLRLTVVDETGNYPEPCEVWYVNGY